MYSYFLSDSEASFNIMFTYTEHAKEWIAVIRGKKLFLLRSPQFSVIAVFSE